jgi:hypothetical protein
MDKEKKDLIIMGIVTIAVFLIMVLFTIWRFSR